MCNALDCMANEVAPTQPKVLVLHDTQNVFFSCKNFLIFIGNMGVMGGLDITDSLIVMTI